MHTNTMWSSETSLNSLKILDLLFGWIRSAVWDSRCFNQILCRVYEAMHLVYSVLNQRISIRVDWMSNQSNGYSQPWLSVTLKAINFMLKDRNAKVIFNDGMGCLMPSRVTSTTNHISAIKWAIKRIEHENGGHFSMGIYHQTLITDIWKNTIKTDHNRQYFRRQKTCDYAVWRKAS